MYCVIQQIMKTKPNPYGEYREIEVYQWSIEGDSRPCIWAYKYSNERFERPRLEAYKITIHQSYREGGAVKKRQYSICTMSYYDIVKFSLFDCADSRIQAVAGKLGMAADKLYDLIETKLGPLRERLEADFHQSPEYIAQQEHERIIAAHMVEQNRFCNRYDVDKDEYNRCYDVFGTLRNKEYLEQLKAQYQARRASERRYRESWGSTYKQGSGGSYSIPSASTYTQDEAAILKQFYRVLAKRFHPDVNHDRDTTKELQLLNRLKEQWGI